MTLKADFEDRGILNDDFDKEPLPSSGEWASYGDYQLVGQSEATSGYCGKYLKVKICKRVELHNRSTLDGVNYHNKVFVHKVHNFCHKPSCKICYRHGWAVREAGRIEDRIKSVRKTFGEGEHIVVSVPSSDYDMEFKLLRTKAIKVCKSRNIIGGCLIFHAFRYDEVKFWYFSPHWHCIGFIDGGYRKCRRCTNHICEGYGNYVNCDGFESNVRRLFEKDSYIVKVLGERKTIYGTAWYQLHHASICLGGKRSNVVTWFGVVSYVKCKVVRVKRTVKCPICLHELVDGDYSGSKVFVIDRCALGFKRDSFMDLRENGRVVFRELAPKKYRGGCDGY